MSERAAEYVRRHLLYRVNRSKGLILADLAIVADDNGRAKMTQAMIAYDLGCEVRTIKRHMAPMLRPKVGDRDAPELAILKKGGGRTYVIIGVAEHDIEVCDNDECRAEAAAAYLSKRRQRGAAARARRAREKQRADRPDRA